MSLYLYSTPDLLIRIDNGRDVIHVNSILDILLRAGQGTGGEISCYTSVIYVLLRPSLGTDTSNFSGLCNGLWGFQHQIQG